MNIAAHSQLEQKLIRLYGDMYRRTQNNSSIKQSSLASLSHIFCSQFDEIPIDDQVTCL